MRLPKQFRSDMEASEKRANQVADGLMEHPDTVALANMLEETAGKNAGAFLMAVGVALEYTARSITAEALIHPDGRQMKREADQMSAVGAMMIIQAVNGTVIEMGLR